MYSVQSNFEFEYIAEFVTEFENIPGYESGAQMGFVDETNSSATVSLRKKNGLGNVHEPFIVLLHDINYKSFLKIKFPPSVAIS